MKKLLLTFLLMFSFTAVSQDVVSSEVAAILVDTTSGDIVELDSFAKSVIGLFSTYKEMGKLALAIALIQLLMTALKTNFFGGWLSKRSPGMKRFMLVLFGQLAGILMMIEAGAEPLSAILAGLLASGGASAIYDAYKPVKEWYKKNKEA